MNADPSNKSTAGTVATVVGILGALLVIAGMVAVVQHYAAPLPIGVEKAELRAKNLREIRSYASNELTGYKAGAVPALAQIPVEAALKVMELEWQNPAAGRSNLLARLKIANPVPVKVPEKPSAFE